MSSEGLISVRVSKHDLLDLINCKAQEIQKLTVYPAYRRNLNAAVRDMIAYVDALPDDLKLNLGSKGCGND